MSKKVFLLFLILFLFLSQMIFNKRVFACVPGETSPCVKTGTCCCSALPCGSTCPPCDQVGCHDKMEYYICQDDGTWSGWGECCSASCFTGETEIGIRETKGTKETDKTKEIKDLKPGDVVESFDPETGEVSEGTVSDIQQYTREGYYVLETESGKKVEVTGEHPFLAVKSGDNLVSKLKESFSNTLTFKLITGLQAKLIEVLD